MKMFMGVSNLLAYDMFPEGPYCQRDSDLYELVGQDETGMFPSNRNCFHTYTIDNMYVKQ